MTAGPTTRPAHPLRRALTLWGTVIAAMWLVLLADLVTPVALTQYGIVPRQADGILPGFIAAPFLHGGTGHLISNMVPLAVLGTVAALRDWRAFWVAMGVIVIVSDLGVWLTSPPGSVTVGASGIVFGLFGYLLGRGVFVRSLGDIAIGVLLILVYGSMVWGIFPSQPQISWQGHLFGFLGGLAAAFALGRGNRPTPGPETPKFG
ncbi:rhomboid family intramembrane serine protease [Glycomyces sp. L485]|uniref:rhomboid family intramembrane serine protease n=1 Tax=Glycomyces sp. L485 TaxID=2909235 RepID=UPI001F4B2666|nr:rhomboid family intramembrane serine protease [Glycomyces sp. L485]MCH7231490.1 rhomboid family intramembrane serine protease [Glycomyces sp. L485]